MKIENVMNFYKLPTTLCNADSLIELEIFHNNLRKSKRFFICHVFYKHIIYYYEYHLRTFTQIYLYLF
jgi:hypothetical protein